MLHMHVDVFFHLLAYVEAVGGIAFLLKASLLEVFPCDPHFLHTASCGKLEYP